MRGFSSGHVRPQAPGVLAGEHLVQWNPTVSFWKMRSRLSRVGSKSASVERRRWMRVSRVRACMSMAGAMDEEWVVWELDRSLLSGN